MANPIPNLFRAPELKQKILFTLFILFIYRFGAHITVPGVDVGILRQQFGALQGGILGIYDMFVGGGLSRATIFALGIMPYISASIMFQLLAAVVPTIEKLQKEGELGRKKIIQLTRYGTVLIASMQSVGIAVYLSSIKKMNNYNRLKIIINNKIFYFNIKHSTNNFIQNILACISVMSLLNLNLYKMKNKFFDFKIPEGRGDIITVKKYNKKFKFIDESYNANLLSMTSAINNMNYYKFIKNNRRIVFLGDMLELGSKSKKIHKTLSKVINKSKIDKVFVCGRHIKETFKLLKTNKKGKVFANIKEANDHFSKILTNNDLLMVKGSNATGLNQFSKNIKKGQIRAI